MIHSKYISSRYFLLKKGNGLDLSYSSAVASGQFECKLLSRWHFNTLLVLYSWL